MKNNKNYKSANTNAQKNNNQIKTTQTNGYEKQIKTEKDGLNAKEKQFNENSNMQYKNLKMQNATMHTKNANQSAIIEKRHNKTIKALVGAFTVVSAFLIEFVIIFIVCVCQKCCVETKLENIYQKNFVEFVDNINNSEVKLSKVVVSNYSNYAANLLQEVSQNTAMAANNLSQLPLSVNGIADTIGFINQISGYTQTVANGIKENNTISGEDIETLQKIRSAMLDLKNRLNEVSLSVMQNSILLQSGELDGDFNQFTISLQNIKQKDVDYPTMIYDGPFAEDSLGFQHKQIRGAKINKKQALERLQQIYNNSQDINFRFSGEANGIFETYDYELISKNNNLFIQVSKNGGEILSISGEVGNGRVAVSKEQAVENAKDFAKKCGVENLSVVWQDEIGNDMYINFAPVQQGAILYADLVKVKVDLSTGIVAGYEASGYFANHKQRNIAQPAITKEQAVAEIDKSISVEKTVLCVAPIEGKGEVLCYEVKGYLDGSTFYYYINAQNGTCENILEIVQTNNGNLIM